MDAAFFSQGSGLISARGTDMSGLERLYTYMTARSHTHGRLRCLNRPIHPHLKIVGEEQFSAWPLKTLTEGSLAGNESTLSGHMTAQPRGLLRPAGVDGVQLRPHRDAHIHAPSCISKM